MNFNWADYFPLVVRRKLDGRHKLQKIIGNTGWLLVDKIIRMGVGLVVGVWVVRFLGPEQFGLFSFALAFATLFSVFATLGLDGIVIRELVDSPQKADEILGAAFVIKLCGGAFAMLGALVAIQLLRPSDSASHWLVAIIAAGMIFQAFDVIDFWFQARVESGWSVCARSMAFLLSSSIRIFLILTKAPLIAFALVTGLELAFTAGGLVLVYRFSGRHLFAWRVTLKRVEQLLRNGWPLALSGVAVIIYMKIDQVMLGEMLGSTAVGVYSAAVRISEVWYFIPVSIVASVSPSLIEAKGVSVALYYNRLARLFRLMSAIALAIAIPMTFMSNYVARVLYGNEYQGVGPILAVHIWAAVFVFIGVAQSPWNIVEGLTKLALLRTSVGAAANVILNIILIPRYGAIGAAVATTVSYALSAFILNAFSVRTRGIFRLQLASLVPIFPNSR